MQTSDGKRSIIGIEPLHIYLLRGLPAHPAIAHHSAYVRNIAYSLQYIDHLLEELSTPGKAATIHSQTSKSVVVVGMGIVEAILWYLLITSGKAKMRDWETIKSLTTPEYDEGGQKRRIANVIEQRLDPPQLEEMTLDAMVKRAERQGLFGTLDHAVYGHLKTLRQLRNRVHIHAVKDAVDTDWQSFTGLEVIRLLNALRAILCLDLFSPTPDHLEQLAFLDSTRVERRE